MPRTGKDKHFISCISWWGQVVLYVHGHIAKYAIRLCLTGFEISRVSYSSCGLSDSSYFLIPHTFWRKRKWYWGPNGMFYFTEPKRLFACLNRPTHFSAGKSNVIITVVTFHLLNLMLMSRVLRFGSFSSGSTHEKFDVWLFELGHIVYKGWYIAI